MKNPAQLFDENDLSSMQVFNASDKHNILTQRDINLLRDYALAQSLITPDWPIEEFIAYEAEFGNIDHMLDLAYEWLHPECPPSQGWLAFI